MSSVPPSGEKSFYVLDQSGARYGPATVAQLSQWALEGRVLRTTTLEDAETGQQLPASSVPGLSIPEPAGAPQGNPYANAPSYGDAYQRPNAPVAVKNNLAKSIFATLCCCLPLGIVAIINAAKVDGLARSGDYLAAKAAADKADQYSNWSIGIGIIGGIIQIIARLKTNSF